MEFSLPAGVWNFYEGRAGMEPRIRELREDYALRKIPTRAFAANTLYLEILRLAYNLVTAFQWTCLPEGWQSLTLSNCLVLGKGSLRPNCPLWPAAPPPDPFFRLPANELFAARLTHATDLSPILPG
jgi:hypothetical protein